MKDFFKKLKLFFVRLLPRGTRLFRLLRKIYKMFYGFAGSCQLFWAARIRNRVLDNPFVKQCIITRERLVVEFCDSTRFVYRPADPNDLLAFIVRDRQMYEENSTRLCERLISEGSVVLDIGASFGWFSVHFRKTVGRNGRVYAFEPVPEAYALLSENLEVNFGEKHGVILEQCAISDRKSVDRELYVPEGLGSAFATLKRDYRAGEAAGTKTCRVAVNTVDDYVKESSVPKVDFMKIDVEGAEAEVLRGAEYTLKKYAPILLVEVNDRDSRDIFKYLETLGYKPYYSFGGGDKLRLLDQTEKLPDYNFFFLKAVHASKRPAV